MWDAIAAQISQATGQTFVLQDRRSVGGGSINQAYAVTDGRETYFVKVNQANQLAMFEAEALALKAIYETHTIGVPRPLLWNIAGNAAFLVTTWIEFGGSRDAQAWARMGEQLAALHRVHSSQGFGWHQNNTIGSTPQMNAWTPDWQTFWAEQRLGYQFRLARRRGGHFPQQDALIAALPALLEGHNPPPSMVHGDLWSGNAAIARSGDPIILDPAIYFGDREVDLAMTELFGGFPAAFYEGYQAAYPLEAGYDRRKVLYNLYHVINHFNLFGGSYEGQANRMIDQLLGWADA